MPSNHDRIEVVQGDITRFAADAIVNAANSSLMGGGGVDGAIHRAGGSEILDACMEIVRRQGPCKTGEAVITTAGKLPARFVIHTVGPVWRGGAQGEAELLANCYRNCLALAKSKGLKHIAFSNISTGVYGYPKEAAAEIALSVSRKWLEKESLPEKITFICFDPENFHIYRQLISAG